MKHFYLAAVFIFIISNIASKAYDNMYFGIGAGKSFIKSYASLPVIYGADDCGKYTSGNADGFYIKLFAKYPVWKDLLFVNASLAYDSRNIELSLINSDYQVYDSKSGTYKDLVRKYTYNADLDYLTAEIALSIKPLDYLFFIDVGFSAGNPIIKSDYTNKERIQSPDSYLYPNQKKEQIIGTGSLEDASSHYSVSGGISAYIDIQNDLYLVPELSYKYGLNSVLSNSRLDMNIIQAGIGIVYKIDMSEKLLERPVEPVEVEITEEKPVYDSIKTDVSVTPLVLKETIVTQTYPLLPYIFFDSASTDLKPAYKSNVANNTKLNEKELPKDNLQIYFKMLDIIGNRMNLYVGSQITLTGTSDGNEVKTSEEKLKIATKRAESVKNYLVNKWGIDKSRIIIKQIEMPSVPTSIAYKEGYEENRRVEITSAFQQLLAPVVHEKFIEFNPINYPEISINSSNNNIKIDKIETNLNDNDNMIKKGNKWNYLPKKNQIDIAGKLNLNGEKIFARAEISENDKHETRIIEIPVKRNLDNFEIGRLNLIVFDFDKFELSNVNKESVNSFIMKTVSAESKVVISGSTDLLGERQYNKRLSMDRAKTVENYIRTVKPDINISEVKGSGSETLYYDNSTPEGRFYCRTVLIELNTPVKK